MKTVNYVIWKENNDFVAQCLNVDVVSQGSNLEEAIKNLKEALTLYFEGEKKDLIVPEIESIFLGKDTLDA